ncbi:hypothetical protein ACWF99_33230 [Nocardia sp. NPDC055002]|uniref:hypothetical protein n=1 Tax=Nocardia sp. NPDC056952 TaxID=3345979 RepID=UPI003630F2CB
MYLEEFSAAGPLTERAVEELMTVANKYTSAITLTVGERTVQLPVLPVCWDELRVGAGTAITVEADRGYRPADLEDRTALTDFVSTFQRATGRP